jgi:ribosomal protein S18 acetylase RimI-like enzyme
MVDDIIVKEVLSSQELREFIFLPEKVHNDDPNWLPPIYMDEKNYFNKEKNKSFNYADTIMYLAWKNNKPVGRIMGIINKRYNHINNENHGRFCFMECYDDKKIFHALLTSIENWLRTNGISTIVGPLGFSDKDPQGFQIEGFEYPPFITAPVNSPYMYQYMEEEEGYEKKVDLVNYLAKMPDALPEVYVKVLSRIEKTENYKILEFHNKKELKQHIIPALELMNETFREIYGFVPLEDNEKKELAANYLPILDPKFIKMVKKDQELIGFAIGMPDVSPGIKACNGHLFPFGILKVMRESRRSKKLLMLLGGVKKEFRGKGIDVLMGVKILESGIKQKMEIIDSHLVLENNVRMRSEYERIGGKVVKRFPIYQKAL